MLEHAGRSQIIVPVEIAVNKARCCYQCYAYYESQ